MSLIRTLARMCVTDDTKALYEAFINFSYTRFHAHKTILGAFQCTWEIVRLKEQTCVILIIT